MLFGLVHASSQESQAGELVESAQQLVKRQHSLFFFFFSPRCLNYETETASNAAVLQTIF